MYKFAVDSSAPMVAVFTATADGLNLPQSVVSFQEACRSLLLGMMLWPLPDCA